MNNNLEFYIIIYFSTYEYFIGQKNVTYTGIKFGNPFNKTYIIQHLHLKVDIIIILLILDVIKQFRIFNKLEKYQ